MGLWPYQPCILKQLPGRLAFLWQPLEQGEIKRLRIQPHHLKKGHVHRLQDKAPMFSNISLKLE